MKTVGGVPVRRTVSLVVILFSLSHAGGNDGLKPQNALVSSQIEGAYTGTLFASGYNMPVVTTFFLQGGVLRGEYVMDENGIMTPGRLTGITFSGSFTIECTWEDKYGAGPASFTFSDDYSGFSGWWGSDSGADMYNWWGQKELNEIQQPVRD